MRSSTACVCPAWLLALLFAASCGGENAASDDASSGGDAKAEPNYDAFFADDPLPQYCGPDGGTSTPPPMPGGTPECPDDKNREGCPCTEIGEKAPCWPGKRIHRERGICKDGETVCIAHGEFDNRWGPCQGFVLPKDNPQTAAEACGCFSKGTWNILNTTPCFISYDSDTVPESEKTFYAVATLAATLDCPKEMPPEPPGASESPWSASTLNVDCAGQFTLCYALKAGNRDTASASDCQLTQVCVDVWYAEQGVTQKLPDLPGWASPDKTCATQFARTGGYGEMSVKGLSIECETVDDKGGPLVFQRVSYCPERCSHAENAELPECQHCRDGVSGTFP